MRGDVVMSDVGARDVPWPQVSPEIAGAVTQRWPEVGALWCSRVGGELGKLCARYGATPVGVMPARFGLVVAVEAAGASLVMRASPDPNGFLQGCTAQALAGLGVAPKVHEVQVTKTGTWMVLDRVVPGTPLMRVPASTKIMGAIAAMLEPLRAQPIPAPGMPSIQRWLRDRLEDDNLSDLMPGRCLAPIKQRETALSVLDELAVDVGEGLCHGDASSRNLLLNGGSKMMLVDPRGMKGDVAYDAAVIALKSTQYSLPPINVGELSRRIGVDVERVRAWMQIADVARV